MLLKFISFCCVATCVFSAPSTDKLPSERHQPQVIRIVSQSEELDQNGTYKFSYETGNGIHREETSFDKIVDGKTKHSDCSNEGGEDDDSSEIHVQRGSYSYTAPDGTVVSVSYIADENGFRPFGEGINIGQHPSPINAKSLRKPKSNEKETRPDSLENSESVESITPDNEEYAKKIPKIDQRIGSDNDRSNNRNSDKHKSTEPNKIDETKSNIPQIKNLSEKSKSEPKQTVNKSEDENQTNQKDQKDLEKSANDKPSNKNEKLAEKNTSSSENNDTKKEETVKENVKAAEKDSHINNLDKTLPSKEKNHSGDTKDTEKVPDNKKPDQINNPDVKELTTPVSETINGEMAKDKKPDNKSEKLIEKEKEPLESGDESAENNSAPANDNSTKPDDNNKKEKKNIPEPVKDVKMNNNDQTSINESKTPQKPGNKAEKEKGEVKPAHKSAEKLNDNTTKLENGNRTVQNNVPLKDTEEPAKETKIPTNTTEIPAKLNDNSTNVIKPANESKNTTISNPNKVQKQNILSNNSTSLTPTNKTGIEDHDKNSQTKNDSISNDVSGPNKNDSKPATPSENKENLTNDAKAVKDKPKEITSGVNQTLNENGNKAKDNEGSNKNVSKPVVEDKSVDKKDNLTKNTKNDKETQKVIPSSGNQNLNRNDSVSKGNEDLNKNVSKPVVEGKMVDGKDNLTKNAKSDKEIPSSDNQSLNRNDSVSKGNEDSSKNVSKLVVEDNTTDNKNNATKNDIETPSNIPNINKNDSAAQDNKSSNKNVSKPVVEDKTIDNKDNLNNAKDEKKTLLAIPRADNKKSNTNDSLTKNDEGSDKNDSKPVKIEDKTTQKNGTIPISKENKNSTLELQKEAANPIKQAEKLTEQAKSDASHALKSAKEAVQPAKDALKIAKDIVKRITEQRKTESKTPAADAVKHAKLAEDAAREALEAVQIAGDAVVEAQKAAKEAGKAVELAQLLRDESQKKPDNGTTNSKKSDDLNKNLSKAEENGENVLSFSPFSSAFDRFAGDDKNVNGADSKSGVKSDKPKDADDLTKPETDDEIKNQPKSDSDKVKNEIQAVKENDTKKSELDKDQTKKNETIPKESEASDKKVEETKSLKPSEDSDKSVKKDDISSINAEESNDKSEKQV